MRANACSVGRIDLTCPELTGTRPKTAGCYHRPGQNNSSFCGNIMDFKYK